LGSTNTKSENVEFAVVITSKQIDLQAKELSSLINDFTQIHTIVLFDFRIDPFLNGRRGILTERRERRERVRKRKQNQRKRKEARRECLEVEGSKTSLSKEKIYDSFLPSSRRLDSDKILRFALCFGVFPTMSGGASLSHR
jgi:hypothetical protein